jgi:3',5'-nucleoside bisphosphate phosphatase
MKIFYDLHIHTGLSPCADNDMTPSNIVNMALLKGLDVISITDHNRGLNVKPVMEVAKETGLIVIPGIEVETKEGIHVVCYFEIYDAFMRFESKIYEALPTIQNRIDLVGEQCIYNVEDEVIGIEERMLSLSSQLSLNQVIALCHEMGGLISLAHINRESNSILTILGFIPPDLKVDAIEWHPKIKHKKIENYAFPILYNSDAHCLGALSESDYVLEVKEKSIQAVFDRLRGDVI